VLDVAFTASLATPAGPLETIKHPVVSLAPMGQDLAQRMTGLTTVTRMDSVWAATVAQDG
jgi:hypothetical protein